MSIIRGIIQAEVSSRGSLDNADRDQCRRRRARLGAVEGAGADALTKCARSDLPGAARTGTGVAGERTAAIVPRRRERRPLIVRTELRRSGIIIPRRPHRGRRRIGARKKRMALVSGRPRGSLGGGPVGGLDALELQRAQGVPWRFRSRQRRRLFRAGNSATRFLRCRRLWRGRGRGRRGQRRGRERPRRARDGANRLWRARRRWSARGLWCGHRRRCGWRLWRGRSRQGRRYRSGCNRLVGRPSDLSHAQCRQQHDDREKPDRAFGHARLPLPYGESDNPAAGASAMTVMLVRAVPDPHGRNPPLSIIRTAPRKNPPACRFAGMRRHPL